MSDVRLTDQDVVLEGYRVMCTAADLVLDHPERRSDGADGIRRAIVHDFEDGLTINWAEDYPGGVTLLGKVTVNELSVRLKEPRRWVELDPGRWRFRGDGALEEVPGGVATRSATHVDVAEELAALRSTVLELKQQVAELRRGTP